MSSGKRWAYTVGENSVAGAFPDNLVDEHINVKEAFALTRLVEDVIQEDTDFEVFCDNQVVVHSVNKTRSKNEKIHGYVSETIKALADQNSRIRVNWISTELMGPLADGPSRARYKAHPFSLSSHGWQFLTQLTPEIQAWKDDNNLISLFDYPGANPAQCPYYSQHVDLTDPLNRGKDFFQAAEKKRANGGTFTGGFLANPPLNLLGPFVKEVRMLKISAGSQIFLILPAFKVRETMNLLWGSGDIRIKNLCSSQNRNILNRRAGNKMSVMIITGFPDFKREDRKRRRRQ